MDGPFVQMAPSASFQDRTKSPIAFLDRDGVINLGKSGYVNSPAEVTLLEGAANVIADLRRRGYLICVVTNQSPIARGLWGPEALRAIHEEVQSQLYAQNEEAHIDAYMTCPHRYEDRCACRKPSPGMLILGHHLLRLDETDAHSLMPLQHSINRPSVNWWGEKPKPPHALDLMVGDRRSDMGAGWAFGARLFRVPKTIGLGLVGDRLHDDVDFGDDFQP